MAVYLLFGICRNATLVKRIILARMTRMARIFSFCFCNKNLGTQILIAHNPPEAEKSFESCASVTELPCKFESRVRG